jgi:putative SOS response-associated peptidase YedK
MCGRVRLSSDYSEIKIRLKFAPNSVAPNFEPDWNKSPTAPMLVAIRSVNGERVPKMMKWGLIPHSRSFRVGSGRLRISHVGTIPVRTR